MFVHSLPSKRTALVIHARILVFESASTVLWVFFFMKYVFNLNHNVN